MKHFDVICAGEALWQVATPRLRASHSNGWTVQPGGGVVSLALAFAREGLRVALVTEIADGVVGRKTVDSIASHGVDVEGVTVTSNRIRIGFAGPTTGAMSAPPQSDAVRPFDMPEGWTSNMLVLSGLSPVVSHAAALCKAARSARREGALVILDFRANLHAWTRRDPRMILMIVREADVVPCSFADLAVIGIDLPTIRSVLRPAAVLVVNDDVGRSVARGPFGEVVMMPTDAAVPVSFAREAMTTAITLELAGQGKPGESVGSRWHRALQRGGSGDCVLSGVVAWVEQLG